MILYLYKFTPSLLELKKHAFSMLKSQKNEEIAFKLQYNIRYFLCHITCKANKIKGLVQVFS